MHVYVAGPMTGFEHYNLAGFAGAKQAWEQVGHTVETPFECNSRVWQRYYGRDFNPLSDKCDYGDPILGEMMIEDLEALRRAEAIVLLPGWEKSKGARVELLFALNVGKRVFRADFTELRVKANPVTFEVEEWIASHV